MSNLTKFLPVIMLIFALISIAIGFSVGSDFIHSRGASICLSCMGLEEHENL